MEREDQMDDRTTLGLDFDRNAVLPRVLVAADEAPPAVLVAGFEGALGAALRMLIAQDAELRVVGDEGEADITTLITEHRPAVALVNHDALTGVSALCKLAVAYPETAIIVAVMHLSRERDERLLAEGTRVVVPITVGTSELRAALRLAAWGLVGSPRRARGSTSDGFGSLTEREAEVLELLARRRSAREIAEALNVTVATVHTHCRRIYTKLGVHSRDELASRAAQLLDQAYPRTG